MKNQHKTMGLSPLSLSHFNKTRGLNPLNLEEKAYNENFPDPYIVTWVTHNSRISERMIRFGIQGGRPVILTKKEEIEITKYIRDIVKENGIRVMAYNICRDHVHMVIVCASTNLNEIVRKLKGKSAYHFNRTRNKTMGKTRGETRGLSPLPNMSIGSRLWAQKFNRSLLDGNDSLDNAVDYVERNREIHGLPRNGSIEKLVREFVIGEEEAFSLP